MQQPKNPSAFKRTELHRWKAADAAITAELNMLWPLRHTKKHKANGFEYRGNSSPRLTCRRLIQMLRDARDKIDTLMKRKPLHDALEKRHAEAMEKAKEETARRAIEGDERPKWKDGKLIEE